MQQPQQASQHPKLKSSPSKSSSANSNSESSPIPSTIHCPPLTIPPQFSQLLKTPHNPIIESMYYRVSQIITEMLNRIHYLFQLHGIDSYIHSYHSAIFKLVVPVELMAYVSYGEHKAEESNQFKDDAMDILYGSNIENNSESDIIHRKSNKYFRELPKIPEWNKIDLFNFVPTPRPQRNFNQSQQHYYRDQYEQVYENNHQDEKEESDSPGQRGQHKRSRKFVLNQEMERRLCEWIKYQAINVSKPTSKEVAQKAKSMSNSIKFRGSTGWCHQFFLRYPYIRHYIKRTTGPRVELPPPKTPQQELEQMQIPPFKYTKLERDANFLRFTQHPEIQFSEQVKPGKFQSTIPQVEEEDESQCQNERKQEQRYEGKWRGSWYDGPRERKEDEGYQNYYKRH